MNKQRRLGRGLEALLGKPPEEATAEQQQEHPPRPADIDPVHGGLIWVPVGDIEPNPYQPRQQFDQAELDRLSQSITDHGMLQPLVVRRGGAGFQIVAGERRWRAAKAAGWEKVPCQVSDVDQRQLAELAIVENVQRKDLSPLEKAASFRRYLDQYQCSQEELAGRVKLDRSTVANLLRLLELPEAVQQALLAQRISQGHARALLPLGEEHEQVEMCRRIQSEGLSVRSTEQLVREAIETSDEEPLLADDQQKDDTQQRTRADHLGSLEQELRLALGTKVDLRQSGRGRGRIVVHFTNHAEFERLRQYLTEHRQATPNTDPTPKAA